MNPITARSQRIGGMIWGIGSALHEATEIDRRHARCTNDTLAECLLPVNADFPCVEVIVVPETDTEVNPLGIKGIGELGCVGTSAAVCNAIHHATGIRLRDLPVRIEHLLGQDHSRGCAILPPGRHNPTRRQFLRPRRRGSPRVASAPSAHPQPGKLQETRNQSSRLPQRQAEQRLRHQAGPNGRVGEGGGSTPPASRCSRPDHPRVKPDLQRPTLPEGGVASGPVRRRLGRRCRLAHATRRIP